jgi:putative nucleotidyltransferase with HDIG domain/PAS domain S-box-containing protein
MTGGVDEQSGGDALSRLRAELAQAFGREGVPEAMRLTLLQMLEEIDETRYQFERGQREWRDAFDAVRDPIFLHDRDYRIVRANKAYALRAGMDIQAVIGKLYWQVFPKREGPLAKCHHLLGENGDIQHEEVILDSGEVFLSRGFAIRDERGCYVSSVHIMEDVTARRQADVRVRESEADLAEAQRIAHLGNWTLDLVSNQLTWSAEIYRIFEIDPREFGASYEAFLAAIHPDDRERVNNAYAESLTDRSPYLIAHRLLMKDGRVKYVREVCETRYGEDGRPLRSLGTVQDITEQYLAEEAVNRSNRALKTISACNSVLVHATDESELLGSMCRVIIHEGAYRFAWIGFVENTDDEKSVRPVAHAGLEEGYLQSLRVTFDDSESGRGPVGCAVRSGNSHTVIDTLADPDFAPWREAAAERGYRSVLSLPLKTSEGVVCGVLSIYAAEPNAFDEEAVKLMQELADDLAFGIIALRTRKERDHYLQEHQKSDARFKEVLVDTIRAISLTLEKRDPYTAGHQNKVAQLSVAIGREIGLDEDRLEGLRLGAMIHDIGKIYVPAEILNRPGRLSHAEFEIIKSHTEVGYDIIKDVKFPWPVADMVVQHHERLDGSGYPRGLRGDEIILEARILAVADVVEAISAHRPYRPAVGIDKALLEIEEHRGTYYDTAVADACLRLIRDKGFTFVA